MNQLGEFVRRKRKEMGLSLLELSSRMEISVSQLSKIERGDSAPRKETIEKIAEALDTKPDDIRMLAGLMPKEEVIFTKEQYSEAMKLVRKRLKKRDEFRELMFSFLLKDDDLSEDEAVLVAEELAAFYDVRTSSITNKATRGAMDIALSIDPNPR
ncbi:helix-turn-helix domain-containing protein [Paenibacillus humicus]|uniref:helix-turn-helix domain-containing protein n=1 Tax=Paenibacillus humicus TaxID=412861 RepID=UPI0013E3B0B1|nr:helix-turn-helix transcriptional regulator [Paenibacillus humicus]